MSSRNTLLLALMDQADIGDISEWPEATAGEDQLLLAMYFVKKMHLARLDELLGRWHDVDIQQLSAYCAFIGMTANPVASLLAFDVLKRARPRSPEVWRCLAVIQLAVDNKIAAVRSLAMQAALGGFDAIDIRLPLAAAVERSSGPGTIGILAGNLPGFEKT